MSFGFSTRLSEKDVGMYFLKISEGIAYSIAIKFLRLILCYYIEKIGMLKIKQATTWNFLLEDNIKLEIYSGSL